MVMKGNMVMHSPLMMEREKNHIKLSLMKLKVIMGNMKIDKFIIILRAIWKAILVLGMSTMDWR